MLVMLDGSELAEVVFPFATELAARLDLEVVLLQVYGPLGHDFIPVHRAYIERAAETLSGRVEELQERLGVAPDAGAVEVRGELTADLHYARVGRNAQPLLELLHPAT